MSFGRILLKRTASLLGLAGGCWFLGSLSPLHSNCVASDPKPSQDKPNDVFLWGNGIRTDRSEYLGAYPNFEPTKVEFSGSLQSQFKKLFFAEGFEAGIDKKGDLYAWPTKSQLSMELFKKPATPSTANDEQISSSQLLNEPSLTSLPDSWILDEHFTTREKVTKISTGVVKVAVLGDYLYALKTNGQIDRHQVKLLLEMEQGKRKAVNPKKDTTLKVPSSVVDICAGSEHMLFLTQEGSVYCIGDDTLGQCGQGAQSRSQSGPGNEIKLESPAKVKGLENKKIVSLAAGSNHSVAVDSEGNAWGWGNNGLLQLSHEKEFLRYKDPAMIYYEPVSLNKKLGSNKVVSVATGDDFSILVTETVPKEGEKPEVEVYGTGANRFGQLGIGGFSECSDFEKILAISNIQYQESPNSPLEPLRVQKVECGKNHCLCLMDAGVLFEWGQNSKGQLGNRRKAHAENPMIVTTFKNRTIYDFSCGADMSGVLAGVEEQLASPTEKSQ